MSTDKISGRWKPNGSGDALTICRAIDSPAVKAEDLRFSEKGIQEILRKVL